MSFVYCYFLNAFFDFFDFFLVGCLGIVDNDKVELNNLHRQVNDLFYV